MRVQALNLFIWCSPLMCPMGLDSQIDRQRASRGARPQAKKQGRCAGEVCGSTKRDEGPKSTKIQRDAANEWSMTGCATGGHGRKCSGVRSGEERGAALHDVLLEKTCDGGALVAGTRAKKMVLQWSRQRKSIPCILCAGWHQSPASTARTEERAAASLWEPGRTGVGTQELRKQHGRQGSATKAVEMREKRGAKEKKNVQQVGREREWSGWGCERFTYHCWIDRHRRRLFLIASRARSHLTMMRYFRHRDGYGGRFGGAGC